VVGNRRAGADARGMPLNGTAATASVLSPLILPRSASSRITDAGPHDIGHINCVTVKL